jgi:hypothetical protein
MTTDSAKKKLDGTRPPLRSAGVPLSRWVKKENMTKNRFIAVATLLAVHSAIIAGNVLRIGAISRFSHQGLSALSTHIISFLGLSLLVLTIKQKIWRTGGMLAALSALLRSCTTSFPDQKVIFGVMTLVISFGAIIALAASWRLETFDLSWWERGGQKNAMKPILLLLVALGVVAIFLFWGRP